MASSSESQSSGSSEHTLQSRPISQSQSVTQHPNQLLHESLFLALKPNNFHLDVDSFKCQHPLIIEILKGHPLYYALSVNPNIPLIYLQQVWHTITYIPEARNYRFEASIDNYQTSLKLKSFRRVLGLPEKNEFPGKD